MPSVRSLLLIPGALVVAAFACDPHYEPPPKGPAVVYIPWQAGPARGPRRAVGAPTTAPSAEPSVQLEDVDSDDAGVDPDVDADAASDAPDGG